MSTLSAITQAHSQRLSKITQRRDAQLYEAAAARDQLLRALAATAAAYHAFDTQVADARTRQLSTDAKAEAARAAAIQDVSEALAEALADAHRERRDADMAAFLKRRSSEEEAEQESILAVGGAASPSNSSAAQKRRAQKLEQAKKQFDADLAVAQDAFRKARDQAMIEESKGSRDADRAFAATARVSDSSARAARAIAERTLAQALAKLPAAAAAVGTWHERTTRIVAEYRRAERDEFERLHREVQSLPD